MRRLVAPVSLALLLTLAMAPAASAAPLACGTVITQNTTLDSDIGPCAGDGLIIGASNVTLNLAGHTIQGTDIGAGIRVAQVTGVVVKNGYVRDFGVGVVLDEADGNVLRDLTLSDNATQGINVANSDTNRIVRNTVVGNGGDAIRLGLSFGNIVRGNNAAANVFGITVADGSGNNAIAANALAGNNQFGIALFSNATANRVVDNTVQTTTAGDGITVAADAAGTKLRRNTTENNADDGIDVDNPATVIGDNSANNNTDLGIEAVEGVKDAGGNTATGNGNPLQCTGVVCS
jgi:parallel beta-helix repeat protein